MKKRIKERRSFLDRRKFSYTSYSPERRSGMDRRACVNKKTDTARVA